MVINTRTVIPAMPEAGGRRHGTCKYGKAINRVSSETEVVNFGKFYEVHNKQS